jgi:site-specific DNA recombinase
MPRRSRPAKAIIATATYLRIATYTRRSTDEDNQPFTIDAQDTKLDAYATSQDGWGIVAKFSDDASGASLDRPGLQRALAAARAGAFDVLLVYRVDRFSRRIRDLVVLLDELNDANVVFRSATEPFDTSTPAGRMLVQMLGVFAEFEREMIIDRVVNGMERKASKGQWTLSTAPEGLEVDPDTQHLRPVPAEVPVIEDIFDQYTIRRHGTRAIAKNLNQRGLRRRSGRPWSFKTVIDVLSNPAYIGVVAFRDIYREDAHPAIIDRDTFDLAQQILTERADDPAKSAGIGSDYYLTGKIRCPQCGQTYLGTSATGKRRRYRYYTCFTRNRYGTSHCNAPRLHADPLDHTILHTIGEFYRDHTDLIMEAVTKAQQRHQATLATATAELNTVTARLTQKQLVVDRYFTDYEDGKIDKVLLEGRIEKLSDELAQLRRRRDELQLRLDTAPQQIAADQVTALAGDVNKIIESGTETDRKRLCDLLLDKLTINTATATATPTFRIDLSATPTTDTTKTPVSTLTGEQQPSSQGVRERRPGVELRGLEPLTPTLPDRWALCRVGPPRAA